MSIWNDLEVCLHPNDQPAPLTWRRCYETKYALARLLQPQSLLEIGVRTGYSAYGFCRACPGLRYRGLDRDGNTHGGFVGAIAHARRILSPFDAEVLAITSEAYAAQKSVDPFEVVHVDGDHSFAGCYGDLELARRCRPRAIIVDDYLALPDVQRACDEFLAVHAREWLTPLVLDDGHNGVAVLSAAA